MKPETGEWTTKAEADLATAQREAVVDESPNYDAVCFHAQQCAEKYLKAVMIEAGMRVPRIHDLEALANFLIETYPSLGRIVPHARILSAMAVEVRYPGMSADEDDAAESLRSVVVIREAVLIILSGAETIEVE
ncbi:MAG: HEPN domain-containing protein [Trichlorobacter sp.]